MVSAWIEMYSNNNKKELKRKRTVLKSGPERRVEPRKIVDEFYSVQFFIKRLDSFYQFILWDLSPHGLCILVDNDSDVLACLSIGDVFKIKLYPRRLYGETRILKTEIRHITEGDGTRFANYHMIGLKILE